MDMSLTGKVVGMSELEKIHRLKTGRFIEFSFVAPVVLSRGTRALSDPIDLSDFALNLGLLFQVVDDILDAIAQQDILGKPVGSDAGNHKATYVALLGVSQAQKAAQELENKLLLMLYDIKDPLLKEGLLSWVDQVANRDR
jgi:geranylgeranyl diphosphate synthase type II